MKRSRTGHALAATAALFLTAGATMAQNRQTGFLDGAVTVAGLRLPYQLYVPSDYDADHAWPLILFLHGAGERGTDGLRQTTAGLGPALRADRARFPALVLMPQTPPDSSWTGTPARAAMAALDDVVARYRVDPRRVYLTGISLGGNGAWYLAYRHPDRFAALVPICGWVDPMPRWARAAVVPAPKEGPFVDLARRLEDLPIWIFHGEVDDVVPVEESRRAHDALRAAGADVRYTELPGTGHDAWDAAYASPALTDWLLAQRRAD